MSEELLQIDPITVGRYSYYKLGATTLRQLKAQGIVKASVPRHLLAKKPDGLFVLGGGMTKAVVEYKAPDQLKTPRQIERTIERDVEMAAALCKLLILTTGARSIWVNALNGERVRGDDGEELSLVVDARAIARGEADVVELERLLDAVDGSLSESENSITAPAVLDPSALAAKIWQKIWVQTGKTPEKCLYNVVELFVFKLLTDLGVLREHNGFGSVADLILRVDAKAGLKHYANLCRKDVEELFPAGDDGTTIINGTIFVNEEGEPNLAQASLFAEIVNDLSSYDQEVGSFRYIKREFKTRLYESFLRQSAGLHHLGQFFTPRNVVRAMVGMSGAASLGPGASVCDPFCGVGGFLLETILQNPGLMESYRPTNGCIKPKLSFVGYDRGTDEKEDERTIILAKANALIYFSDLLSYYSTSSFAEEFATKVLNSMFTLVRTNLGTFEKDDKERHDLILTNPPYVTGGSRSLKDAIQEAGLADRYGASGRGTESLATQWIVRSLKPGGVALMIVPDGLLNQGLMLEHVKEHCLVRAIVSLPTRTFYATTKKTYILAVKKKSDSDGTQSEPVLVYLVSETGETRDANRWPIAENDLEEAMDLYNQFKGSPGTFRVTGVPRCKVVAWSDFCAYEHWMVDRVCWSDEELMELGAAEETGDPMAVEEFNELLQATGTRPLAAPMPGGAQRFKEVLLGDESLFELRIGKRVLKKDCVEEGIPCISANVHDVFGYVSESSLMEHFETPSLTWGIDGIFDWHLIPSHWPFHPTDHCGVLRVLDAGIDPAYLHYALRETRSRHGFDRTYRANLENVAKVAVEIPVDEDEQFDLQGQREIAAAYGEIRDAKDQATSLLRQIAEARVSILDVWQRGGYGDTEE